MKSSRGTSTKEAYSQTELIEEFWDLVELTNQPQWAPSPQKRAPKKNGSKSKSLWDPKAKAGQGGKKNFTGATRGSRGGRAP
uniref:ORF3 n=1 Tax=Torque teno Leptonychotes weddellii virus-1 TaxID=2012676 RepID=A0A1Z2RVD4_9VIRU|nr:ORF3 [Torque teno Leptonychotes weddellii virus 1]ASA48583.1 ORF3 [Torque teno Leptonychotes weddellii virus 1]